MRFPSSLFSSELKGIYRRTSFFALLSCHLISGSLNCGILLYCVHCQWRFEGSVVVQDSSLTKTAGVGWRGKRSKIREMADGRMNQERHFIWIFKTDEIFILAGKTSIGSK